MHMNVVSYSYTARREEREEGKPFPTFLRKSSRPFSNCQKLGKRNSVLDGEFHVLII